jgi:hypothetical protein
MKSLSFRENIWNLTRNVYLMSMFSIRGGSRGGGGGGGGGAHPARALPKIGKNMISWRKIVIFHTKYPKYFRASLRSAQLKSWIRPWVYPASRYQRHILEWCLIHISSNFCVGTRVWRVWNLQSKNNFKVDFSSAAIFYWPFSSVIDRNRNRPFNLIQNKVGYRSCFATGVKLEQFLWNSFDVK